MIIISFIYAWYVKAADKLMWPVTIPDVVALLNI